MANTFKYFAFGSNLLKERLQLRNPSARYVGIGKLKEYKLCFDWNGEENPIEKEGWHGCPATIKPHVGHCVWGTIWDIHSNDLPNLDVQEGVPTGIYRPLEISVETTTGDVISCRTYELLQCGSKDPRPSPQYLDVITRGAKQSGLPEDYIQQLLTIETNGYTGKSSLYEQVLEVLGER